VGGSNCCLFAAMYHAVLCGYRGVSRQMAPYVYDVSREGDSNSVESEEKSFSAPRRNQTVNLLLMRRGWYYKTIASALSS
jgi:hypothetical protein